VGSVPFIGDLEKFQEGAERYGLSFVDVSARYFEDMVVKGFLDKLQRGITVPNYPQFRDMNRMFLEMIDGVERIKGGYIETEVLSVKRRREIIPEVLAIKRNSQSIREEVGEPFRLKVCVTGPYTLSTLFVYRDKEIFTRLGEVISGIVKGSVFNEKHGGVRILSVDEPAFGMLDDPLMDYGSEGRENLRRAWESIFHEAHSRGVQTCLHLHSTVDELFWDVNSLDIIESHVDDPLYHAKRTRELLEKRDKLLKASICITNFDWLIRKSIVSSFPEEMRKLNINRKIAEAWKKIRRGELDPVMFLEDVESMRKRLVDITERFGAERVPYAGPECGLRSFPTYDCALEYLNRVSRAVGV